MYRALVSILFCILTSDSSSEWIFPSTVEQVSQNLHLGSRVGGEDSIKGYALQARGRSWYILHMYPPCGDLSLLSVSRKGHVFPLDSFPINWYASISSGLIFFSEIPILGRISTLTECFFAKDSIFCFSSGSISTPTLPNFTDG